MLNPSGPAIQPKRAGLVFGEAGYAPLAAIENAVVVAPQLFVPRGSDLKAGDKFTYQGQTYFVVGAVKWDIDQSFTGQSMGYVEFEITAEKGPANAS